MIALFIVNMQIWIGDKDCFVAGDLAYSISSGEAGEIDVAGEWKTWSLCGAIFWGIFVLANTCYCVSGYRNVLRETREFGDIVGLLACCGCCISCIGIVLLFGFTIWGGHLRFGHDGTIANQELLKDSGTAMRFALIFHFLIFLVPFLCCIFLCLFE